MPTNLLEKAIESVGGTEAFKQKREQFSIDLNYISEHKSKLLKDYNERWVAVYQSKVVAHGKDYNRVLAQLEKENLPVEQIPIRYLSKRKFYALYLVT